MSAVASDVGVFMATLRGKSRRRIPSTPLEFDDFLRRGIPNETGRFVAAQLGLDRKAFATLLQVSPATLDRRNEARARFRGSEADALYRVMGVLGAAERVLKTRENVLSWMNRAQPGLGGRIPMDLVGTSAGAEAVVLLLNQIHHGIVP